MPGNKGGQGGKGGPGKAKAKKAPKEENTMRLIVVQESVRLDPKDISVARDSGWRELSDERVKAAQDRYLSGDYKRGILTKPKVLWLGSDYVRCQDGRIKIFDGKTTIAAILKIGVIWQDDDRRAEFTWTSELTEDMNLGTDVCVVSLGCADPKEVMAYNVYSHNEQTNVYQATTIENMVDVAMEFKKGCRGQSWGETQRALEESLGQSKRTFVWRCCTAAQVLTPKVHWGSHTLLNGSQYQSIPPSI